MSEHVAELATGAALIGGPDRTLTQAEVRDFIREQLGASHLDGKSVCLVIPDGTRSARCRCCWPPSTPHWPDG